MAIWDSIKNMAGEAAGALSTAASDVSTGAKNYSEKSKLKRAISTEELNIKTAYRQMGEKLFNESPTPPPGYESFYEIIEKSNTQLEVLRAELSQYDKKPSP